MKKHTCNNCLKRFRDKLDLTRHELRVFPCKSNTSGVAIASQSDAFKKVEPTIEPNNGVIEPNNEVIEPKAQVIDKFTCSNCLKKFRDNVTLQRHLIRIFPCQKVEKEVNVIEKFTCDTCLVKFRDKGDLNRHLSRKTDCSPDKPISSSLFSEEDINIIDTELIIDQWRIINKEEKDEWIRATKLIIYFHALIKSACQINTINLPSIKAQVIKIQTNLGTLSHSTIEGINLFVKTRAKQLLTFKDSIDQINELVFKSENSRRTWLNIEKFSKFGLKHTSTYENTRNFKTNVKVALL
jgi:hypothetical protein